MLDHPVPAMEQAIAEAKSHLDGACPCRLDGVLIRLWSSKPPFELADANGFEAVTLAAVAEKLGIRIPSLYNHVDGLAGLRSLMSLWAVRELDDLLRRAAVGNAGADAILSMADSLPRLRARAPRRLPPDAARG